MSAAMYALNGAVPMPCIWNVLSARDVPRNALTVSLLTSCILRLPFKSLLKGICAAVKRQGLFVRHDCAAL